MILGSEALWFPFAVRVVLANHVRAGFNCMRVNSARAQQNKCNLSTHWLSSDDKLSFFVAFFIIYLHTYADVCLWSLAEMSSTPYTSC